jgi:hypothetical protein
VSGSGNHGTITGTTKVSGKLGQALKFNGTSNVVNMGNAAGFVIGTEATYSAWVKPAVLQNGGIVSKWTSAAEDKNLRMRSSGKFTFFLYNTFSGGELLSNTVATVNTWYHVVGVYDGSQAKIYINGVLDNFKDASGNVGDNNGSMYVGWNQGSNWYFNGSIDDVRIYNKALSATEIRQLYKMGESRIHKRSSRLLDL